MAWFAIDRTQAIVGERLQYQGLRDDPRLRRLPAGRLDCRPRSATADRFLLLVSRWARPRGGLRGHPTRRLDPIWTTLPYDWAFPTIGQANAPRPIWFSPSHLFCRWYKAAAARAGDGRSRRLALMLTALAFTLSRGGHLGHALHSSSSPSRGPRRGISPIDEGQAWRLLSGLRHWASSCPCPTPGWRPAGCREGFADCGSLREFDPEPSRPLDGRRCDRRRSPRFRDRPDTWRPSGIPRPCSVAGARRDHERLPTGESSQRLPGHGRRCRSSSPGRSPRDHGPLAPRARGRAHHRNQRAWIIGADFWPRSSATS